MRLLRRPSKTGRVENEGWRIRKDGSRFWADVIVTALLGSGRRAVAFAKVTRDLTERRAAEEQQRTLLAEQRARAAAEEALATRDRFLAIASHELRTPVASLQLAIEGLDHARSAGRLDAERIEVGLRRMSASVTRLGALVAELLDVSRLESLEGPFHPGSGRPRRRRHRGHRTLQRHRSSGAPAARRPGERADPSGCVPARPADHQPRRQRSQVLEAAARRSRSASPRRSGGLAHQRRR